MRDTIHEWIGLNTRFVPRHTWVHHESWCIHSSSKFSTCSPAQKSPGRWALLIKSGHANQNRAFSCLVPSKQVKGWTCGRLQWCVKFSSLSFVGRLDPQCGVAGRAQILSQTCWFQPLDDFGSPMVAYPSKDASSIWCESASSPM